MEKNEDIVIKMLKVGRGKLSGITNIELLKELDIGVNESYNTTEKLLVEEYGKRYFFQTKKIRENGDVILMLSPQGYFDLLNYQNMQESRSFSRKTMRIAIISIVISIITLISSIIFNIFF